MTGSERYAAILRRPHVRGVVVAAFVGGLPIGMTALAMVLLVEHATGAFAAAAAFAIGEGIGQPLLGRAVDRRGQTGVLRATTLPVGFVLAPAFATGFSHVTRAAPAGGVRLDEHGARGGAGGRQRHRRSPRGGGVAARRAGRRQRRRCRRRGATPRHARARPAPRVTSV